MGKSLREAFFTAAAYMGAVIGGGFASGQEVLQFFLAFGPRGSWGLGVAGLLLALSGGGMAFLARAKSPLFPGAGNKLLKLSFAFFLFASLGVALSGSKAVLTTLFSLPPLSAQLLTLLSLALLLWGQLGALVSLSGFFAPFFVLLAFFAFLLSPAGEGFPASPKASWLGESWLWAAVLYASYNSLLALPVLLGLGARLKSRASILGGFLGGLGIGATAFFLFLALKRAGEEALKEAFPLVFLFAPFPLLKRAYLLAVWLALLTTAGASSYGLLGLLKERGLGPFALPLLLGSTALFLLCDFPLLVGTLYPLCGYLGFLTFIFLGGRLLKGR